VGFGSFKEKKKKTPGNRSSAPFILPGVRYTGQTGLAAGNRYPAGHPVHNTNYGQTENDQPN